MRSIIFIIAIMWLSNFGEAAFAQKRDSSYVGIASGIVRDSAYNFSVESATIAIYKVRDSSLVSYQLSNNFGEFHFKDLPLGLPLRIVVTFVGYKTFIRPFSLPTGSKQFDFRNINIERSGETNLKEVTIKATPPVRMNGDTLEFNADAFTLDKNAVAEDLLRRLPGITVWGDGTITFNGKPITQVLVEGKPFFGHDLRIATQNLPKEAIDKIQVYRDQVNPQNLLDSTVDINIKLKKDKNFGYFGKIAGGYGTNKRFEGDANLNYFDSRTQIGLVGASNNVNKAAKDVATLLRNSTYKGNGASIEYQPDFRTQGINRSNSTGFTFQRDFITKPDTKNNDRLQINYFLTNTTNTDIENNQTITRLGGDSAQVLLSKIQRKWDNTNQAMEARYDKKKKDITFFVSATANIDREHSQNTSESVSSNPLGAKSNSVAGGSADDDRKNIHLESGFASHSPLPAIINDLDLNYSIDATNDRHNRNTVTKFTSFTDVSKNTAFDRDYANDDKMTKHHLYLSLGDFAGGFFGHKGLLKQTKLELKNNFDASFFDGQADVWDRNVITQIYEVNHYLTNKMATTITNERPSLALSRNFDTFLANRFIKSLNISLIAETQFFSQTNTSSQLFQNFNNNYTRFTPSATVSYRNDEFGDFEDTYNLNFLSNVNYPTAEQLRPLVDSSNQYYIRQGNPFLKPSFTKTLSFSFEHISRTAKNTFKYRLSIAATIANNFFADSVIIDNIGRSTFYTVNAEGNKSLNLSGNLSKAFKFNKSSQLQTSFSSNVSISRSPGYVNTKSISSNNLYSDNRLNLYYTYKDLLAVEFKQAYTYYRSKQIGSNRNEFKSTVVPTSLSGSLSFSKRLTINSNITYNHTTSTGSNSINYTIWNASATYRFLEGNNLELKVAALDLLRQNTNVINYVTTNYITRGTTNVLQQYAMVTISYYPRKFGKSVKEK